MHLGKMGRRELFRYTATLVAALAVSNRYPSIVYCSLVSLTHQSGWR